MLVLSEVVRLDSAACDEQVGDHDSTTYGKVHYYLTKSLSAQRATIGSATLAVEIFHP